MLRRPESLYEQGRSVNLLKFKVSLLSSLLLIFTIIFAFLFSFPSIFIFYNNLVMQASRGDREALVVDVEDDKLTLQLYDPLSLLVFSYFFPSFLEYISSLFPLLFLLCCIVTDFVSFQARWSILHNSSSQWVSWRSIAEKGRYCLLFIPKLLEEWIAGGPACVSNSWRPKLERRSA